MKIRGKHQAFVIVQELPSYRNNKLNLYSTQHLDGIIKFCSLLGIEEKIIIWTGCTTGLFMKKHFYYTPDAVFSIKENLYDILLIVNLVSERVWVCVCIREEIYLIKKIIYIIFINITSTNTLQVLFSLNDSAFSFISTFTRTLL